MLVFISFFLSVFCKSVLDTSILCHGEQWCQFHGFTDSLQSLQLNETFEFEMYDISMASLCTWKNEAFETCVVMVTLPDRVPVLPVKNYPYPIPEESATRHSPSYKGRVTVIGISGICMIEKRIYACIFHVISCVFHTL